MQDNKITIFCKNDGQRHKIDMGRDLYDLSKEFCNTVKDEKTGEVFPVLAALVDNQLKELSYKPTEYRQVEFIGINHPDGRRTYVRSLCFVLQNAVRKLYPDKVLVIDHSLPSGLYCEIQELGRQEDGRPKPYFATDAEL